MEPVDITSSEVVEAVVTWVGWGTASWPQMNDQLVVERYGKKRAAHLVPLVRQAKAEFFRTSAYDVARDLLDMGRLASADFRSRYPTAPDELVEALAWCYMYTHK